MSEYGPYSGPTMADFDEAKPKPKAEDFLKLFGSQVSEGLRSRQANTEAAKSGFLDINKDTKSSFSGGSSSQGGMNKDLTVVHYPSSATGPFEVKGTPGKKGFGSVIGRVAGTALGLALAPVTGGSSLALAGLGGNLGGAIGESFEG